MLPVNSSLLCKKFSEGSILSVAEFGQVILVNQRRHECPVTQNRWADLPRGKLRCRRTAFHQPSQLGFGNYEFREATIQTEQKLWKDPHDWLLQTIESREMNGDFPVESTLIFRPARLAMRAALRGHHYASVLHRFIRSLASNKIRATEGECLPAGVRSESRHRMAPV